MVAAAFLFSVMASGVQRAAEQVPNTVVVFFRNAVALALLAPFILRGGRAALSTRRFGEHVIRTAAGLGSMYCFFFAVAHLRLADAVLLNYTLPLFIPFIEWLWLGQPLEPRLFPPIALGFAGVILVLRPGAGLFQSASLVGLCAGLLSALAQTGVRRMTTTEPAMRIVFYFSLLSTLASAAPLPAAWVTPGPGLLILLVATGACAAAGQLLMTRAYAYAPAAQVGAFIYSAVPFSIALDWIRHHRLPGLASWLGAACICAAGGVMLRLGRR